ncbi:MAG: hypothetical protein BWY90_01693 [Deltaproteobacteria bacterium ADurb.BinA014]|nr:MAG: hypothetical protein BWY90_01693 [Deltaproteobacteria bacterium ADurb.BinA014]
MGMKSAFMTGGDNHVNAGFFTAHGGSDGRNNMNPNKSRSLDFFSPAHRVAGRGIHYLKGFFHLGIFFPCPDGRFNHYVCLFFEFRRYHDIRAENTALVLDQTVSALQNRVQHRGHIVVTVCLTGIAKRVVNPGLVVFVKKSAGRKQSQATRVGCRHTKIIVGKRPHARLNNRMLDAD